MMNFNESGLSLKDTLGRQQKYEIVPKQSKVIHCIAITSGNLDQVTVMYVVSAIGCNYISVIVYPGSKLDYRFVNSDRQKPLDWLPPCYF